VWVYIDRRQLWWQSFQHSRCKESRFLFAHLRQKASPNMKSSLVVLAPLAFGFSSAAPFVEMQTPKLEKRTCDAINSTSEGPSSNFPTIILPIQPEGWLDWSTGSCETWDTGFGHDPTVFTYVQVRCDPQVGHCFQQHCRQWLPPPPGWPIPGSGVEKRQGWQNPPGHCTYKTLEGRCC
jgi:hypothetical protein